MKSQQQDLGTPIICPTETVIKDWIDYNGHLNMAFYNVIFDHALDYLYDYLGIGEAYATRGLGSCFVLEAHVHYISEIALGDEAEVKIQLVDHDTKRIHIFQEMYNKKEGYLAATSEQMGMHVDMTTRRSSPLPDHVQQKLSEIMSHHNTLAIPQQLGHRIGIKKR
jgi:acyl-CoA thioester hydrolase